MNIFVTDQNPNLSAFALDDKRVIKMILESTQLLCSAVNYYGGSTPYKSTHLNHPCSIWVRQSQENWEWLYMHTLELCDRYQAAYNKVHKCLNVVWDLAENNLQSLLPNVSGTPFVNCTSNVEKNISFKHIKSTTTAYKYYLVSRWNTDKRKPTWTNRKKPSWLVELDNGNYAVYNNNYKILYEKTKTDNIFSSNT